MPGSFDDEDRKANNDSDWESDEGDNDDSDDMTESEGEEDDEDRYDDDDEDEGNDDDEDDDGQNFDEDEDDKSNDDDDEDDDESYPDEETGLRYQDDDDDDEFGAVPLEQNPYQNEPVGEDKDRDRETTRKSLLACFLCCICLLLLASAVVLGVIFSKGSDTAESSTIAPVVPTAPPSAPASTPGLLTSSPAQLLPSLAPWPTIAPTISPAPTNATTEFPSFYPTLVPSMNPTLSLEPTDPVPDELLLLPEEDTSIFIGGFSPGDSHGKEGTLLVQNGPRTVNEVPDAYALLLFSLEDLPQPWRITDREPQAILRLTQVVRSDIEELAPSNLTVVRLPATPLAVETLDGLMFEPYDGITGPSFIVNATQRRIEVDVTSLIFDQAPFVPNSRRLQGKESQFFIMIENQGLEQPTGGNRFASRESLNSPELYIGLFQPGAPRPTKSPTPSPTTSSQPSVSAAPSNINGTAETTQPTSVSSFGSVGPTSISPVGTKAPTISNQTVTPSAPSKSNQTVTPSAPSKSNQTVSPSAPPTKADIEI